VRIASFAHKGLKKLYLEDNARGVPPEAVDKLRKMFAWLDNMEAPGELLSLPAWKPHVLKGDRHHTWSLSVSRNRRLTFRIDIGEEQIVDLNLEDYH
jgi:proteic killer suppression protein